MIRVNQLQTVIKECDMHAKPLEYACSYLTPYFPLDEAGLLNLNNEHLSYLDQLVYRFSKLQDAMGAKLFPMLVDALGRAESRLTFIDMLNILEKSELLSSAKLWREMREFRNHLTHEYPDNPELMIKNINAAPEHVKNLLACWSQIRPKAVHMKEQVAAIV